ncbi:hypothetical protein Scep_022327 [Stephania cephalantha]|uniref:PLAT domain-containing protein n=1 Tax=Stephania cephalantha TaxID=152367 RepID=A0AAP0FA85_9MAGN
MVYPIPITASLVYAITLLQANMTKITNIAPLALFLIIAAFFSTLQAREIKNDYCDYEMVVSTGPSRGPSTKLKVILEAIGGDDINTTNVVKNWGAMGPKHTYFLPNSNDIFRTRTRCLEQNFCVVLIQGKKGELKPHWYINNITVATKGPGGIDRFKTFRFLFENEFSSLYPPISDGECP